jgi:hypothetical protein
MFERDKHGRLVYRAWYETKAGQVLLTGGWLLLVALCLCWACDVMPINCPTPSCRVMRGVE